MRFGVREFKHFLSLFSHTPGKEDLVFRADFLSELCEHLASFAVKSFNRKARKGYAKEAKKTFVGPLRSGRPCDTSYDVGNVIRAGAM